MVPKWLRANSKRYWASFTDYLTLPNVLHFSSVPELISLVEKTDLISVSRAMRKVHVRGLRLIGCNELKRLR